MLPTANGVVCTHDVPSQDLRETPCCRHPLLNGQSRQHSNCPYKGRNACSKDGLLENINCKVNRLFHLNFDRPATRLSHPKTCPTHHGFPTRPDGGEEENLYDSATIGRFRITLLGRQAANVITEKSLQGMGFSSAFRLITKTVGTVRQ